MVETVNEIIKSLGISPVPSTVSDPMEQARRRVKGFNTVPGTLTGYDCPVCLNRGYSFFVDDLGHEMTRDCSCMKIRRARRRIARSGLADMLTRYTFETWQTPEPWQKAALELAQQYARDREGWFLAAGHSGTGKTHLCTAICGALLDVGVDVRYMLWRDVSVQAKAVANDAEEYARIVDPLKVVDLLYIDDLFKAGTVPTAADVNLVFEIINARYNDSGKLTIISTERGLDELLSIDEAIGSRIYERCRLYYLDFGGRANWRLKK